MLSIAPKPMSMTGSSSSKKGIEFDECERLQQIISKLTIENEILKGRLESMEQTVAKEFEKINLTVHSLREHNINLESRLSNLADEMHLLKDQLKKISSVVTTAADFDSFIEIHSDEDESE